MPVSWMQSLSAIRTSASVLPVVTSGMATWTLETVSPVAVVCSHSLSCALSAAIACAFDCLAMLYS